MFYKINDNNESKIFKIYQTIWENYVRPSFTEKKKGVQVTEA